MKVLVLGGGVVGVATAYFLAEEGYAVTLVERNSQAACESSYGNAGLYTPGDSYAWASPEALAMAVKSLYRRDLGIKYRLRLDPALWAWTWKFLFQCTRAQAYRNTLLKLRVTMYSRERLAQVVRDTGVAYDGRQQGVVYAFRDAKSLDHGAAHMQILKDQGLPIEVLDRDGLVRLDPGLKAAGDTLVGGVYSPMDQTGDSCKFARHLAAWCAEQRGVTFLWGTTVQGLDTDGRRVTGVRTDKGPLTADTVVLATGPEAPRLAGPIGVTLPIYPVKGYSVTVPVKDASAAPSIGLVDEDKLIAMSRLGDRLRMASTAEFAGYDRSHKPADFAAIFEAARGLFPDGGHYDQPEYWAGLRPMTPSSVPILGRAKYENFYLNTGHGHVGWTMSCGTGKFVADMVAGRQPEIDPSGLTYTG